MFAGRAFPVTTYYLEDAFQVTDFEFPPTSQCIASQKGRSRDRDGGRGSAAGVTAAQEKQARKIAIENLRRGKQYSERTLHNLEIVEESVVNTDLILKLVLHIMASANSNGGQQVPGQQQKKHLPPHQQQPLPAAPNASQSGGEGAILIFVPGLANIQGRLLHTLRGLCSSAILYTGNTEIYTFIFPCIHLYRRD